MAFDRAKPLSDFAWSYRVRDAFREADLKTVGDVMDYGVEMLLRRPNFGLRSLQEVENVLGPIKTRNTPHVPDLTLGIDTFAERYIDSTIRKWRQVRRRLLGV